MSGFRRVGQFKRGNPVLHYIRKAEKTRFTSENFAQVLDRRFAYLDAIYVFCSSVIVLLIGNAQRAIFGLLAKGEVGLCNIMVGVVVKRAGTTVCTSMSVNP